MSGYIKGKIDYTNNFNKDNIFENIVKCDLCNRVYLFSSMPKHKKSKKHINKAEELGVPSNYFYLNKK